MCSGFSLGKIVCFRGLEFIADCFGDLSLSPKGSNSGVVFMGSTCSGSPSLWDMIEDSTKEFYLASSGEGGLHPPLLPDARHGGSAIPSRNHIMAGGCSDHSGHDDGFTMALAQQLDTGLPLERWRAF
jgi:hypothetical protein